MLKLSDSRQADETPVKISHIDPSSIKFNKLSGKFLIVKPGIRRVEDPNEYDIYLFDRLADQLFGIKNLSSHIADIKRIIKL